MWVLSVLLFLSHSFLRSFADRCDTFFLAVKYRTCMLATVFHIFPERLYPKSRSSNTFNTKFGVSVWHVQDESEHFKPPQTTLCRAVKFGAAQKLQKWLYYQNWIPTHWLFTGMFVLNFYWFVLYLIMEQSSQ